MTGILDALGQLPAAALIALAAVFVVQVGLQIFGLVDLARRPRGAGGRKWPWLLVILFGQLLGAIIYLVVGRSATPAVEDGTRSGDRGASPRQAIDSLYGDRRDP